MLPIVQRGRDAAGKRLRDAANGLLPGAAAGSSYKARRRKAIGMGMVAPHRGGMPSSLATREAAQVKEGAGNEASQKPLGESLFWLAACWGNAEGSSQQRSQGGLPACDSCS